MLLNKFHTFWRGAKLAPKSGSEPEPINARPRAMVGLFARLTPEQKDLALKYDGPENHGRPEFLPRKLP